MSHKMVKFMILSDTHNFVREEAEESCPLAQPLPEVDVVLHCGDLTQVGGLSAYKKALRMLGEFEAELKLVIAGNHDISLDKEYWNTHLDEDDEPEEHDEAVALMTGPLAKAAKVTYLTEGTHSFTLQSGATFKIFVSPYTPEFCDWAFGYKARESRWTIPQDVDIVMTHGPPEDSLDFAHGAHTGCTSLRSAVENVRPLIHCFGHIHEGYGVQVRNWPVEKPPGDWVEVKKRLHVMVSKAGVKEEARKMEIVQGDDTLMVNAAIMNGKNKPVNAPWVVDLELQCPAREVGEQ